MKIKPEETDRLAELLIKNYRDKELLVSKSEQVVIKKKIKEIITKNFSEEEEIEQEARKILDSHAGVTREMDSHKLFLLTKQRVAKRKGFVL